jgi:hypothetical protein
VSPSGAAEGMGRWHEELVEALGSLLVVGLARVDPHARAGLEELAERGEQLGLHHGAAQVRTLLSALGVSAPDAAFAATMRAVVWATAAGREVDLLRAEVALEGETPSSVDPVASGPRLSGAVDIIGAELRGKRLSLHGVSVEGGVSVRFDDQVHGVDAIDPLHKPAVTELLGAKIPLVRLRGARLLLLDHPVQRFGRTSVVRPSWERAVRTDRVGGLATAPTTAASGVRGRPGRVAGWVRRGPDGAGSLVLDGETSVEPGPLLASNLEKLLAREREPCRVHATVRTGPGGGLRLLELATELEDRSWPHLDARAFAVPASVAFARAASSGGVGGLWMRCVLGAVCSVGGPQAVGMRRELRTEAWSGVQMAARLARGAMLCGVPSPVGCTTVDGFLAARGGDLAALAGVLGQATASEGDALRLVGAVVSDGCVLAHVGACPWPQEELELSALTDDLAHTVAIGWQHLLAGQEDRAATHLKAELAALAKGGGPYPQPTTLMHLLELADATRVKASLDPIRARGAAAAAWCRWLAAPAPTTVVAAADALYVAARLGLAAGLVVGARPLPALFSKG